MAYEHYAGITSQVYFCASPVRLDTQSACQMACTYCFAKARGGHRGQGNIQLASAGALRARLRRASEGRPRGVFEQFLERRIAIQLGGMADPFARASVENGVLGDMLAALNAYRYPTIISTKGRQSDLRDVLQLLKMGSYYVRLSVAASTFDKCVIEPGTPSEAEIFESAAMLTEAGIPVCVRIQPIFPDAEAEAVRLAKRAAQAGAVAVSLEYLKIPRERRSLQFRRLDDLYNGCLADLYRARGASCSGREMSLSLRDRKLGMARMKSEMNAFGVRVGIAENELLHYGDLTGCCNGASSHLKGAVDFDYNVPAVLKAMACPGKLTLAQFAKKWAPNGSIARHFNSTSRLGLKGSKANWRAFFLHRWRTKSSFFNPTYFDGVSFAGERDAKGELVYDYVPAPEFSGDAKSASAPSQAHAAA